MTTARPILERGLDAMAYAGMALTVLVSTLLTASAFVMPSETATLFTAFIIFAAGITAGVVLLSLSKILGYLRIIATGKSSGKVFE